MDCLCERSTKGVVVNWQLTKSLVVVCVTALIVPSAEGAGWFNMPSSPCQCLGYGYGPGYHAPLVLGSPLASGSEAKRLIRVQRAPLSPAGCTFGAPSSLPVVGCPSYHGQVPTLAPGHYVEGFSSNQNPQKLHQTQPAAQPQATTASRMWNLRW